MKWIAHQVRLSESEFTMPHQEGHSERVLRHVQLVADVLAKPLGDTRVLDLACLEGGFTIELAMQGTHAIGLEGRKTNVERCESLKEQLGLRNCRFIHDDVRHLSRFEHGTFDIILCLGILYHLTASDGVDLLKRMYDVCERAIIIDTHVALFRETDVTVGTETYSGRTYCEFSQGTPPKAKEAALQSSLDNDDSFWMTEESLVRCLQAIGFTSVMKVTIPPIPLNVDDRVTFVAVKGIPVQLLSCDMPTSRDVRERTNPFVLRASFTDKELVSIYQDRRSSFDPKELQNLCDRVTQAEGKNRELTRQLQTSNARLDQVLNSRGWRLLERYRKIKNRVRSVTGS